MTLVCIVTGVQTVWHWFVLLLVCKLYGTGVYCYWCAKCMILPCIVTGVQTV